MAKLTRARSEQTCIHLSNLEIAAIAGQLAAREWLDNAPISLSQWRDAMAADIEKAIGGCDDMPERMGAWRRGFSQAIVDSLEGKGESNAN